MKQRILSTILVTSSEALERCLMDAPTVFCIEDPLFSEIASTVVQDSRFADYDIRIHKADHYMILLRSTGPRAFDPQKHRFIYHPIIRYY